MTTKDADINYEIDSIVSKKSLTVYTVKIYGLIWLL